MINLEEQVASHPAAVAAASGTTAWHAVALPTPEDPAAHPASDPCSSSSGRAAGLLVVLLGFPGAGKTALAAALCELAAQHGVQAHHLCLDELLLQHAAAAAEDAPQQQQQQLQQQAERFSAAAWQACRQTLLQQVQQHLGQEQQQQQPALPQPQTQQQQQQEGTEQAQAEEEGASPRQQQWLVLVDDNNFYQSMRYQLLQLARQAAAAFLQLHVACPLELAMQRNRQRQGPARIPDSVLQRCADAFEPPDPLKRPWEAGRTWTVQAGELQLPLEGAAGDRLWQQLRQHWGPSVPPLPDPSEQDAVRAAATAANLASRVHQADLASRAMLYAALEHVHTARKPQVAKALNDQRKQMLQQLRQLTAGGTVGADTDDSGSSSSAVEQATAAFQYMCLAQCTAAQ